MKSNATIKINIEGLEDLNKLLSKYERLAEAFLKLVEAGVSVEIVDKLILEITPNLSKESNK